MNLYRVEQQKGTLWQLVLETYDLHDALELYTRLRSRHERGLEPGVVRVVAVQVEVIK